MRVAAGLLTLILIAIPGRTAADPSLLSLLPPDSTAVGGLNLDAAKASPMVAFALSQMAAGPAKEIGFDPGKDLHEIVAGGRREAGLIAARGNFPVAQLMSQMTAQGATTELYRGITIVGVDPGGMAGVAFLDATTAVAGTKPEVQGAIDRWIAHEVTIPAVAANTGEWSAAPVWGVATKLLELAALPAEAQQELQSRPEGQMVVNILSKIDRVAGSVDLAAEQATLRGHVETFTAQDARALADVFAFVKTLVPPDSPPAKMIAALELTVDGTNLDYQLKLTDELIMQMMQQPAAPSEPRLAPLASISR